MTLFEKEPQAGGHTLTDDSPGYPVDLGFQVLMDRCFIHQCIRQHFPFLAVRVPRTSACLTIVSWVLQVYNLTTYPNLVGLLEQLDVDSEPSDMSFALSMDDGALEWGSHGLHSIFAQRRNMLSPSFYRMIWDVIRFGKLAPAVSISLSQSIFC